MTRPLPAIAQKILDKLITSYQPQKVILFGSYAWGEPNDDSDLDLLVVKETQEKFMDRAIHARHGLENVSGTQPLDLVVFTPSEFEHRKASGDPFIKLIVEEGRELYAA